MRDKLVVGFDKTHKNAERKGKEESPPGVGEGGGGAIPEP